MDCQYAAPVAETTREDPPAPARSSGARVLGLIALFGAFCWFITVAPALASLTLAIVTAVAWSIWLDRQPGASRAAD